jgi:HD-GYP domain-containing protein (c-di-GMP phosphodiesterase class II)
MFAALASGVFFLLLYWVRRREQRGASVQQRLELELAETRRHLDKAEHRAHQLVSLLNAIGDHRVTPTGRVSWKELADFTVQTASALVGMETVVLLRQDAEDSLFKSVAARGLSPEQVSVLRVRSGEGVLGRAIQAGKIVSVGEPVGAAGVGPQESFLTAPYLLFPLHVDSELHGLLVFCRPLQKDVQSDQIPVAALVARQLELTMDNLELFEDRRRVYTELVATLSHALSRRDPGSPQHGAQCQLLVRAMARDMHLPAMLTEQIEFGAILHDLGKLGISDTILNKTTDLTDAEYAEVKKHPQIGYEILHGVESMRGIAAMVLYHHEWINGQGYPEGLAGEEIPLGARMIGIVDAWDAMTTDQTYRKALSKSNAVGELRQRAGTQFDPKLIDVFLRVVDQSEHAGDKTWAALSS